MTLQEAGDYVISTGKYRGRTIRDVAAEDPKYVLYCATGPVRKGRIRKAARIFFGFDPADGT